SGAADGSRRHRNRPGRAAPRAGTGSTGRRRGCFSRGGCRRRLSRISHRPDYARWSGPRTLTNGRSEMSADPYRSRTIRYGIARYGRAIKDYYEDLWERLPEELEPPEFERRLAFLRDQVRAGDR